MRCMEGGIVHGNGEEITKKWLKMQKNMVI